MSSDMVHDTNHQRRVFRILEMRVICVAITEMETELHAGRHPGRDLDHSADQCLEIADRCRKDTLEDGELKRGIPLYRQLIGRYGGENLVEFAPHRCAIERLDGRSEEHTSELQSLMRISYAVFCLKTKKQKTNHK